MPRCSIALQHNGEILARHSTGKRHTEIILPMIDALLQEKGISMQDVGGIVYSAGPGGFTGLRVGASVTIGLACARNIPVCAISSLALLAASAAAKHQHGRIVAVLDARMKQVYAGDYQVEDNEIKALSPDRLCNPDELAPSADASLIAGSGCVYHALFGADSIPYDEDVMPDAQYAFLCAKHELWQSPFEPVSLRYLRNKVTG